MASKKESDRQKRRNRVNLDIDPDVDAEMEIIATELGISRSQLYQYFAVDGMDNLDDPEKVKEIMRRRKPQRSLKFPFSLEMRDRLAKLKKKRRDNE